MALWIAGLAEHSFGSPFKFQGKASASWSRSNISAESPPIFRSSRTVGSPAASVEILPIVRPCGPRHLVKQSFTTR